MDKRKRVKIHFDNAQDAINMYHILNLKAMIMRLLYVSKDKTV